MKFETAFGRVKAGKRVARKGWVNTWLYFEKGATADETSKSIAGVPRAFFEQAPEGATTRMPHLAMRNPDGTSMDGVSVLPSDLLASDWVELVDEGAAE